VSHGLNEFALCVGRIEPRKNQLRLVQALRSSKIPVVMVGRRMNAKFFEAVKQAMKSSDVIIEETNQEQLKRIYAAARVHVLPSIYETPGLASLEAVQWGVTL
jgi:glycosyltransferase involved in cell wall biosynthesis